MSGSLHLSPSLQPMRGTRDTPVRGKLQQRSQRVRRQVVGELTEDAIVVSVVLRVEGPQAEFAMQVH